MAQVTNLGSIDLSKNKTSSTQTYFNNYFNGSFTVSPNVNDAIVGFFEKVTGEKESAKVLATSIIYTAVAQNMDPMKIMDQFFKMSSGELNAYLIVFLNLNRRNTSLLGMKNIPLSNDYVKRTIMV
jgi:hypothetical protein